MNTRAVGPWCRPWLFACAACILCALPRDAAAQSAPKHDALCVDSVTTRKGVYTEEQASRGRDIYAGNCRSCHSPETHTGATFDAIWNKRSLAELFGFIRERMPKNAPGSLSDQEYADVLAYLLKMNRMPAGQSELPPDSASMKSIRIQTTKTP